MDLRVDQAERDLAMIAAEVRAAAAGLVALDTSSWQSLAAEAFRSELTVLAGHVRHGAEAVEQIGPALRRHAAAAGDLTR
jgi:uncharacterized protein YukE